MILDGHIGFALPEEALDSFGRYLKAQGRLGGYESLSTLLTSLDADGVTFGLLLHGHNEHRLRAVRQHPDRLGTFAGVSLRALQADRAKALVEARRHIEAGCLGFGEITPYREGVSLDDPAFLALAELALELAVPLHLECTANVGEHRPGRVATPLYDFERLATRYPELKLILSSWGGGLCLFEMMPELPATLANVYYDTASPVDDFDVSVMMRTVPKVAAAHKILYGSAAPLKARRMEAYRQADVPPEVVHGVLGNNLALLLGLGSKLTSRLGA